MWRLKAFNVSSMYNHGLVKLGPNEWPHISYTMLPTHNSIKYWYRKLIFNVSKVIYIYNYYYEKGLIYMMDL
jgi:hypothetical protein